MHAGGVGEVDPHAAWSAISDNPNAILIDVRTRAEWSFVGAPNIGARGVFIEWASFPTMAVDPDFAAKALGAADAAGADEIYFLCRSGARSMSAAVATTAAAGAMGRTLTCYNVAEGFEGDLNSEGRRGEVNGWKARGLPWRQS